MQYNKTTKMLHLLQIKSKKKIAIPFHLNRRFATCMHFKYKYLSKKFGIFFASVFSITYLKYIICVHIIFFFIIDSSIRVLPPMNHLN